MWRYLNLSTVPSSGNNQHELKDSTGATLQGDKSRIRNNKVTMEGVVSKVLFCKECGTPHSLPGHRKTLNETSLQFSSGFLDPDQPTCGFSEATRKLKNLKVFWCLLSILKLLSKQPLKKEELGEAIVEARGNGATTIGVMGDRNGGRCRFYPKIALYLLKTIQTQLQ